MYEDDDWGYEMEAIETERLDADLEMAELRELADFDEWQDT